MEEGILTLEQEKKLASLLDDVVKLKGIAEFIDGYLFKAIITFVDNKFVDKLKEEVKIKLAALVEAVMAEDVELAESLAADLINSLVDIPGLDEESEGLLFKGVIEIIVGAILDWIESKRGKPVALKLNKTK
jgi:hypothetical protein